MSVGKGSAAPTFIDTNVWLYAVSQSQDPRKHVAANQLIRQTPRIVLSTQIVNELTINLLRKFHMSESDVRKLIRSLYRKYLVMELNRSTLLQASDLRASYSFSFWDSLVVASALAAGATTLYSEDMQNGLMVQSKLHIVNPFVNAPTP